MTKKQKPKKATNNKGLELYNRLLCRTSKTFKCTVLAKVILVEKRWRIVV